VKRALTVFFSLFAACAILMTSYPQPARANAGDTFTIYNQGYHVMYIVNAEPSSYGSWGPDLLGTGYTLSPGHSFQPLSWYYGANPSIPSCIHDIRVIYSDGHVEYDYGVDICSYNVSFYY